MSVLSERIDSHLRLLAAYGVMLCIFMLSTVSLSLPISGSFEMPLVFIVVYYWSIYRPTLIPVWLVFVAGLAFDLLSASPIGLNAFIYIILRWIVVDQRLFLGSQPFIMVWIGYVVASLMVIFLQWALFGLINFGWSPVSSALSMFGIGVFLYPVLSLVLHLSHRLLPHIQDPYSAVKR